MTMSVKWEVELANEEIAAIDAEPIGDYTPDRWAFFIPTLGRADPAVQATAKCFHLARLWQHYGLMWGFIAHPNDRDEWDTVKDHWVFKGADWLYTDEPLKQARMAGVKLAREGGKDFVVISDDDCLSKMRAWPDRYDMQGHTTRVDPMPRDVLRLLRRMEVMFDRFPRLGLHGLGMSESFTFYERRIHAGVRIMRWQAVRPQVLREFDVKWEVGCWDDLQLQADLLMRGGQAVTHCDWYSQQGGWMPASNSPGGATLTELRQVPSIMAEHHELMMKRYPEGFLRATNRTTGAWDGVEKQGLQFSWQKFLAEGERRWQAMQKNL